MNNMYGEIKVRKNFFPNDARDLVEKGRVRILLTQAFLSEKTKAILKCADITVYEGLSQEIVENVRNCLNK